jgi:hypothetical protein
MPASNDPVMNAADPLLAQRPTINPYRYAARLIADRLRWDLNWKSWVSRARLRRWRDKFKGQKAVIVCNGPSLLKTDLGLLENTFTFGLNKINLLFEKNSFRPKAIVAINQFVLEQNASFYNETDLPLFLNQFGRKKISFGPNVIFLHVSDQHKLARDCSISVNSGYTVTLVALQLAYHMGFTDVGLIGCDHTFSRKGPANLTVTAGEKDPDHFDPNYFAGGVQWQLPDLFNSELYYSMAHNLFIAAGRRIVNCTDGGCLEVFPRAHLEHWVRS